MLICLLEKYYLTDPTGGSLHIILDDGNYGKENVQFCLECSIKNNDFWGEQIAKLLLEFNDEEHIQIIEKRWEIEDKIFS